MEENKINVTMPFLKYRNGRIYPKEILEKALEEWKQKGMPSVVIEHKDGFFDGNTKKFNIEEWKKK